MPTGAELLIRTICELGISEVFTLVGDHLNEVLLLTPQTGIRVIDMRHESGVTHAADAWARIHRRPAVSMVTGGPGHTNSLTGIAAASLACSPVRARTSRHYHPRRRAECCRSRGTRQICPKSGLLMLVALSRNVGCANSG
jgi:thiamine pyrophosphate-dependent acetolactate synthase large subunit-like protein